MAHNGRKTMALLVLLTMAGVPVTLAQNSSSSEANGTATATAAPVRLTGAANFANSAANLANQQYNSNNNNNNNNNYQNNNNNNNANNGLAHFAHTASHPSVATYAHSAPGAPNPYGPAAPAGSFSNPVLNASADDRGRNVNCDHNIEDNESLTQSEFMSKLVNSCRYDKLLRPQPANDDPVTVRARVYVYFMQATDAHDMMDSDEESGGPPDEEVSNTHFKLHFLLQLRYLDPRLSYESFAPNRKAIIGEDQLRNGIWTPHVFISNEKISSIMGTDAKDVLVSISPKGIVLFSRRIQATIYCWMNLAKFPFDEQTCAMNFESWMYSDGEVELKWETQSPVTLAPELHLSEFTLRALTFNESVVYSDWNDPRHGGFSMFEEVGNFSSLSFSFIVRREMGYYMMDYFIPSMMIVAISWVSFWLQADQSAPRITLGTSTMLSFITLASSQGKTLPKVSYIKASEIWFLGCTGFIFGSLVEFAFVNIIWRRKQVVELKKVNSKYILKSTLTPRLGRKDLSGGGLTKSHSCSSLDGNSGAMMMDAPIARPTYNNYLTVHSFPSQLNLPTITTQSYDDLVNSNGSRGSAEGAVTVSVDSEGGHQQSSTGGAPGAPPKQSFTTMTPQEIAMWIDTRSRLVFPIAFFAFNIIYFTFVYCL